MKLAQIQILTHHAVLISLDKNYIKVLKVAVFIKIVMVIKRVLRGVREENHSKFNYRYTVTFCIIQAYHYRRFS